MQKEPETRCDLCGEPVNGRSLDLMISHTTYDDWGFPDKTLIEPGKELIKADYYTICHDKRCLQAVANVWNSILTQAMDGLLKY